jgi:magnesium transporter
MITHIYASTLSQKGTTAKSMFENTQQASSFAKDARLSWFNFVVDDVSKGAEDVASEMSLSLPPSTLLSGYLSNYEDRSNILGMMLPIIRVEKNTVTSSPLLIYIIKNQLITIHDEHTGHLLRLSQYSDVFMKKLPLNQDWTDAQTSLLLRIIDEISEQNFRSLRNIIEHTENVQMELARSETPPKHLGLEIFKVKGSILTFLNAVWASRDVIHFLRYSDADLISDNPDTLVKFDILLVDLDRQLSMAENVLEVLSGGVSVIQMMFQASMQSASNLMTKVLLWLTILGTAILIPNTLATIYGIPYLPLDSHGGAWQLIATSLTISTIIGTISVYYYVRKVWNYKATTSSLQ